MRELEEVGLIVPKGDYGYSLTFYVKNDDAGETVFDLTDYTVTLKLWPAGRAGAPYLSGVCVIEDAVAGKCYYTIKSGDLDKVGIFSLELQMTKMGKKESTRSYQLQVTESPSAV
jgi:hypothetical protein